MKWLKNLDYLNNLRITCILIVWEILVSVGGKVKDPALKQFWTDSLQKSVCKLNSLLFWQKGKHLNLTVDLSPLLYSERAQNFSHVGATFIKIGLVLSDIWARKDFHVCKPQQCLYQKYLTFADVSDLKHRMCISPGLLDLIFLWNKSSFPDLKKTVSTHDKNILK